MKFSLFGFVALGCISIFALFIINTQNTDSDKSLITNNIQQSLKTYNNSSENITQAELSKVKDFNILELNTFRFSSIDGAINVDKNNHLIINEDLRHWFDFYLSAIGEIEIDKIILLMEREINTLPNPGKEQAHKIMTQYLAYKHELAKYDNQELRSANGNSDIEQLSNRLDWQMRLRRRHLEDKVVEIFWKKDEIIDSYALEKIKIRSSKISELDKNKQLEELDVSLPEELKSFKQELYIASNLLKKENALEKSSNPSELRNLRIKEVGIEATDRLEVVDKIQQDWQRKILAYHNKIQELSNIEGVSKIDKDELISQYRQDNFNEKERLRLNAAVKILSDTR